MTASARTPAPGSAGSTPADHSLTRRIAAGDELAYATFYQNWFAPVLSLARAVSRRDEAFCLDVVQDVMLTVARRMPALGDDVGLRAWLTRTVVNAVTDRVRAETRRQRRERVAAEAATATDATGRQEPWSDLVEQERRTWLAQSVAALPSVEQALLQARFGDATSVAAVANDLGISSDAAHGRLRRALDKLRRMAAEWIHG